MHKGRLINLINIPQVIDDCYLYYAQNPDHIPFEIKRIYFITEANTKLPRGYHAHKKNRQVTFCIQGQLRLILDDGKRKEEILLDKPNTGVFIDNMIWHEMVDFRKNTILLVLASLPFDEKDYIRDYEEFKKRAKIS